MSSRTARARDESGSILGRGLYTVGEAGRIIHAKPGAVRQWVHKGLAPEPVNLARGETTILSFLDLVSLKVVRRLRLRGVTMPKIREAELYLREQWGLERPFATEPILTDGRSVLLALGTDPKRLTSADRRGQEVIYGVIKRDLETVTYGPDKRADSWAPTRGVLLRPDVQLGTPCVEGTRVPTRSIYDQHLAGDSSQIIAWTCAITARQIARAITYEKSLAGSALAAA